jgi:leucyl-tRNA synthetase
MDTFVDSSWYHIRYISPLHDSAAFDADDAAYWMPVDLYIGGVEHAVMHLMYFRYFNKFMRDFGMLKNDEPATRLFTQGMVIKDGAKMSKSKGNVVDPNEMVDRYGADALRMFILFASPPAKQIDWTGETGIEGMGRFLQRVWKIAKDALESDHGELPQFERLNEAERSLIRKAHQTIKRVTDDISVRIHHNTALAAIMELANAFGTVPPDTESARSVRWEVLKIAVKLVYPFAPHFGEELWEKVGDGERLTFSPWPEYVEELAAEEMLEIMIQVNGKLRGKVKVPPGTDEELIKEAALREDTVKRFVEGKTVRKVIYVPEKLMNIVVA